MYVNARVCTEIMHRWMQRDLRHRRAEVAIDLGAGAMRNRPYIPAKRYVAVDIDPVRIEEGKTRFPDAEGYVGRIEDFDYPGGADIVLCIQVLLNKHFDPAATVPAINKGIALTRPGGCFLFTIGPRNAPAENEIDKIVQRNFASVEKVPFGRLDFISPYAAAPIGYLGSLVRSIWEPADPASRRVYYCCSR